MHNRFISLLILLIWGSCQSDLKKVDKIASQKEAQIETARQVDIQYYEDGQMRVKILAPTLKRYVTKNPYLEMPDGLRVLFYDDRLEVKSRLTAEYGISYEEQDEMMVRDNVEFMNNKGERLNTEELIWNEKKENIYSDKFVKIKTEDEVIYGRGMEANQDFTDWEIRNIEKGSMKVKEGATSSEQSQ
jgi:LPS export ABC transporter protein LptC